MDGNINNRKRPLKTKRKPIKTIYSNIYKTPVKRFKTKTLPKTPLKIKKKSKVKTKAIEELKTQSKSLL